ncbi:MAG: HAMP domain-containing sensor histidine kinase [Flavobacteriaceae bacterium]
MGNNQTESDKYIEELEEKIINLSIQLKSEKKSIDLINESHNKLVRRLIHDLKNPAGVVTSFSEMILEDIDFYDTDKLKKHIGIIKKAADYSILFLVRTAKFLRLNSPKMTYLFSKLDYIDLLNQVIDKHISLALDKGINIISKLDTTSEILLLDSEEMDKTVSNIIGNAIRYSNENTTITISVTTTKNTIETLITDGGIGVSKEDSPKVFDEYFVVNTYSSDKEKCVGLGLTMSKIIIEQHQGTISFESELDKGSEVKITLPKLS